nr:cell division cycle 20.2, cofactor of APC complex [Tanacetum cinerariifolium]
MDGKSVNSEDEITKLKDELIKARRIQLTARRKGKCTKLLAEAYNMNRIRILAFKNKPPTPIEAIPRYFFEPTHHVVFNLDDVFVSSSSKSQTCSSTANPKIVGILLMKTEKKIACNEFYNENQDGILRNYED